MCPDVDVTLNSTQCRPSIRVAKAAALLEVDISTIYRLIRNGNLESHRIGKRGVRVFADSLSNYQDQQKIIGHSKYTDRHKTPKERSISTNTPAYQDAIAYLRSIGCL